MRSPYVAKFLTEYDRPWYSVVNSGCETSEAGKMSGILRLPGRNHEKEIQASYS